MNIKFKNLFIKSSILSLPGFLSIIISLLSIPIHLNYAGSENYGNYIIFHFVLLLSINLNIGIGKSVTISINNYLNKKKEISYEAIIYTKKIAYIIFTIYLIIFFLKKIFNIYFIYYDYISDLFIGSVITVFFITFEGILQGNKKFKYISLFNLFFFSLSVSVPSIFLSYNPDLTLDNLIKLSVFIKLLSVFMMFLVIKNNDLYKISNSTILWENLKKNSKWITINGILIQFYDLLDKYLIKIFIGPIAVTIYSVPQQLAGKLSIISKSFSALLLPDLSKKKNNNDDFNFSLLIFIKYIPIMILLLFPVFPFFLKFWLGNAYEKNFFDLTKIFSLSTIFSCASHILITKYEASKILYKNLRFEFYLLPIFLIILFYFTIKNFSLLHIAIIILLKEFLLFFIRLYFLKSEIINFRKYYIYSLYYLFILFWSFFKVNYYYIFLIPLIIIFFKKNVE